MLNFILVASSGILTILNLEKLKSKLRIIGLAVGSIGAIAVVGYILNAPLFYYFIEGINSAMAFHTAILFVLLGAGLSCL
jgi:nitric oxide reductase large subunit